MSFTYLQWAFRQHAFVRATDENLWMFESRAGRSCSPTNFRFIPWFVIIVIRLIQMVVRWSGGRVWEACSPVWPLSDQRGGDKWLQHSSLSAVGGGRSSPPTVSYIIPTTLFFSYGLSIEALCDWHGDPLRLIGSLNCVTAREAEQTLSPL